MFRGRENGQENPTDWDPVQKSKPPGGGESKKFGECGLSKNTVLKILPGGSSSESIQLVGVNKDIFLKIFSTLMFFEPEVGSLIYENRIYKIISQIPKLGICPFWVEYIRTLKNCNSSAILHLIDNPGSASPEAARLRDILKTPNMAIVTRNVRGPTFYDLAIKLFRTQDYLQLTEIILQVLLGLSSLVPFRVSHQDLHLGNILVEKGPIRLKLF